MGLNSVSWNLSRIIGPGLAGLTIHLMGLSPTFFIATAFNVPLILCLYFLVLQPRSADTTETSGFMKRMIDGGTVALRTPLISSTLILVSLNSFFVRGILEIQPAIVGQIMGGKSYDLAIVTAAAGLDRCWHQDGSVSANWKNRTSVRACGQCSSPALGQAPFCICLWT